MSTSLWGFASKIILRALVEGICLVIIPSYEESGFCITSLVPGSARDPIFSHHIFEPNRTDILLAISSWTSNVTAAPDNMIP